jgi:hypothetical protein
VDARRPRVAPSAPSAVRWSALPASVRPSVCTGRPASARLLRLHWLCVAFLANLADAQVMSVTFCAKCRLARIVTLMTETAHGTEFCSNNQMLLNGPLSRICAGIFVCDSSLTGVGVPQLLTPT